MGTTYKGQYLPATSEVGWQALVNANFTALANMADQFQPASTGYDHTGAVPALFGTFPNAFPYFLLANSVTNGATWVVRMPGDMTGGVTCTPVWIPSATDATAHSVRWQFSLRQASPGSDIGGGVTDTVTWTGTASAHTANVAYYDVSGTSTALTLVSGNVMRCSISRLGADAADTYVGDARLLGITIGYA